MNTMGYDSLKMQGIMNVTVVIPVYNESKNILDVLKKIPKEYEIIVVDDGSYDNTYELVKKTSHKCIRLEKNKGKGFACISGAKEAKNENIVFLDGDGQHDPMEIEKLIEHLNDNDIVIGKRSFSSLPLQRKISNKFARLVISIACNKKIEDALCGFRAVKKNKFFSLELEKNGYEFESEMLIKASKKKMKIKEVPVSINYNSDKGMSVTKSFKLAFYIISKTIY